jgi:hypothetical protein
MSLAGTAVVAIWNDIEPDARSNFYEWHSREHMPERVSIPGFLRGRRLVAERGSPEWFTLYEVDQPSTLAGAAYLARLNNPTEWTRRVVPSFTNVTRSLCRTQLSTGTGIGGAMLTLRCDAAPERAVDLERYFEEALPKWAELPQVHGAHLCRLEAEASSVQTEERKARVNANRMAEFVVMIEASLSGALEPVLPELRRDRVIAAGASGDSPLELGLYRLEFLC